MPWRRSAPTHTSRFWRPRPSLIAIFAQSYGLLPDGRKVKHYYVQELVGIATGMLIAALHHAGLATLTHTPSPMAFLNEILDRPAHERPFLLLVVGYPADRRTGAGTRHAQKAPTGNRHVCVALSICPLRSPWRAGARPCPYPDY